LADDTITTLVSRQISVVKAEFKLITEVPIEIFSVRRLDWRKCHPVQKH